MSTMAITASDVNKLRQMTGAGMMDCKSALTEANGDFDAAVDILRKKGQKVAAKRADREANEGYVVAKTNADGTRGVLVAVNCETDFVANTDDFKALAKDLATHIAAANPLSVSSDDLPADLVERERQVYLEQVKAEGKPPQVQEKIVEGKIRKFFEANALMSQPFVKDPDKTIEQLITEVSAKTGEKIEVARFARFQVGSR